MGENLIRRHDKNMQKGCLINYIFKAAFFCLQKKIKKIIEKGIAFLYRFMYYMAVGGDLRYLVDRKHHKVVFGGGKGSAPPFYSGKNLLERQAI